MDLQERKSELEKAIKQLQERQAQLQNHLSQTHNQIQQHMGAVAEIDSWISKQEDKEQNNKE